jgi:hypothetical protein
MKSPESRPTLHISFWRVGISIPKNLNPGVENSTLEIISGDATSASKIVLKSKHCLLWLLLNPT